MAYDSEKGKEVLTYIISRGVHDMYHILKAVYFADEYHLEHYGRQINGNQFIAMSYGPVPAEMYDFIKAARSGCINNFSAKNNDIYCTDQPNMDWLSESDVEALDYGIQEVSELDFHALMEKSHDKAYNSTKRNEIIPLESIVAQLENGNRIMEYLNR